MRKVIWVIVLLATGSVLYLVYQRGYEEGRGYTAETDAANSRKWVSKKWGYEITFPSHWEPIKRWDASIKSPGADVFCSTARSASTTVFAYPRLTGDSLDKFQDEIVSNVKQLFGQVEMVEEKDYMMRNILYKKVILKAGRPPDRLTYHYTFVLGDKAVLLISSNAAQEEFESFQADFDSIADSVRFLIS